MASDKKSGRRKRPWWKKEGKVIHLVDGFQIRNLNPDFSVIEHSSPTPKPGVPYIPEDEIWLDERFEGERDFLLKVLWYERRCPETGERSIRAWLNERLAERTGPPSRMELREITVKTQRNGKLLVRYVRGEKVRRWWDVWFVFGGHDLIYPAYIPENEVWIDVRQDSREVKYTLHHELHERKNMAKGMSYPKAHRKATASEQKLRSRELVKRRKRRKSKPKPLDVMGFHQRAAECGNTSLKCVCWYHGKRYSAKRLGELCGLTEDGIDHVPLAVGATRTGAHAFVKDEGSISELRRFLERGYPVIVGWWSILPEEAEDGYLPFDASWDRDKRAEMDAGHYSVVHHITDEWVYLMDPQAFTVDGETIKGGFRRMRIKTFLDVWYDTDGPDYEKVERWYLVVNYDGKTFADVVKGGKDYLPEGKG